MIVHRYNQGDGIDVVINLRSITMYYGQDKCNVELRPPAIAEELRYQAYNTMVRIIVLRPNPTSG